MAANLNHPIQHPVDVDFAVGQAALNTGRQILNQLIEIRAHLFNAEARRINRAIYMSGSREVWIPMRHVDGSSPGATFPRNHEELLAMTPQQMGTVSAHYGLTHIPWLNYASANNPTSRRRKILAFLGCLDL
ncbi:uncharacterized protein H6S33_009390 [Morchella sextelata]|jgi:hypothetical protein|uniref:uncharacterized protein n=1 Tax=Morchella sextelata TaxID=1174677 RepID=UPI001D05BC59|nr:uncharacterized protein H6S33_005010 [Morchella sextelata]XP_044690696.1 uncharacterized protein H6S33_004723 [Morchella sextelata]XP_044695746.1 uncharacterized protein H6S33_012078 [Morchella sextelata]XP_044698205.1 uncharacterized protein H6S33_009390 [Morchella sextelata]KAH0605028.1 hypothetical protein H6S33_005010 [Morchella sextelata]KAH0605501.1 hypothetical protein H6S33_004723 [Morchella sextelata]KAH0610551.1 hypothetical protein H6S33_012078 [Morchella sextelata]KAH0613010.1